MSKNVQVKQVLDFLSREKYDFTFTGNEEDIVVGFSTLFNYKQGSLTFVSSLNKFSDYKHLFEDERIQLAITDKKEKIYKCFNNVIQIDQPKSIFFSLLENVFTESEENHELISSDSETYTRNSYISEKALIGENVKIGYGCVIEANVKIGDNTVIHHNVVIKSGTTIGKNCSIFSGTVIGENGFNPLKKNNSNQRNMVEHYGGVMIGDQVHIGDNSNISKGTIENTEIADGVKINKQVVIAHNVNIGKNTVFTAPVFIGGSVKIGENCHIAANVIRNQCQIGDRATLGLGAVVVKDVEAGTTVVGNPARPIKK